MPSRPSRRAGPRAPRFPPRCRGGVLLLAVAAILPFVAAPVPPFVAAAGTLLAAAAPSPAATSRAPARTTVYTGDVEGKVVVHEWQLAGARRRVFVLLPPSLIKGSERRYPVLYALDGQDLFDPALAAGKEEWTLDEILARHPDGVQEMFVVAVETSRAVHELAPPGTTAQARGDSLLDFLADTVRPFVESAYPVRTGRDSAMLLGLGRSALFAAWAAWWRADLFAGAIVLDCPDLDAPVVAWTAMPPRGGRPWFWYEQRGTDEARPSSTDVVAALQRHADVQVVIAGVQSHRTLRLLAALRAWPRR